MNTVAGTLTKASLERSFQEGRESFLADWQEFLRIRSISSDPEHAGDCRAAAEWLVRQARSMGMTAELIETVSKPLVFAEHRGSPGSKTIVFYGHYDVQPVDPVEKWISAPFEPTWRDGRLYARGAQDNKGQIVYVLKALETLLRVKALGCSVKLVIEGEEECGSRGIAQVLPSLKERIAGDILMVCDTGSVSAAIPAITMGLRGNIGLTVTLRGPNKDLHSGVHGGVVRNPATEMARLVASLHDHTGRIAIAGYYDGIPEIDPQDRALLSRFPLSLNDYEGMVGAPAEGGERALSAWERRGFRPTMEINGIHSGYDGPGGKTIIPSEARLKITSRLVAGQDPQRCMQLIEKHLREHTPRGVNIEFSQQVTTGGAFSLSSHSERVKLASKILHDITGVEALLMWEGASIPIVAELAKVSGAEPIMVGFGLEEDNIHAPNESFSLKQFQQGYLYAGLFLAGVK